VLGTLLLAGCGGGGGTDAGGGADVVLPDTGTGPGAELGTGEVAFETLTGGQELFVIQGPQGGFHFLGAVRAWGIEHGNPEMLADPDNPTTEFRVFRAGARIDLMASRYVQGLRAVGGRRDLCEMINRLVILDITSDDVLDGVEVEMEVTITDVDGVVVTDRRPIVAVPHPANP
jgi:hypothetical protein